ncbi:unnamed protein product [Adineta steineri]|uniref:Apple domain-containing protein n=1 Tax=Adineta steineri TaxID=433720 RepID=A0A815IC44_9BILA|nr:unnamed protein product [Adineta steineri]CAF3531254.1 unnamed protein product [Adineta steineri]
MNTFTIDIALLITVIASLIHVANCASDIYVAHTQRISSVQFQPPIIEHYLDTVNAKSVIYCVAACNKHDLCRTCDYDSSTKQCRLFESLGSTGTLIPSIPTSSVFILNYCLQKTNNYDLSTIYSEPDYICTPALPGQSMTVYDAFQKLIVANNNVPLPLAERDVYMSSNGFYTSSSDSSAIRHYGYNGQLITAYPYSSSLSCINYNPKINTFIVCPYSIPRLETQLFNPNTSITMSQQNISTVGPPFYSYYDTNRLYISYRSSASPITIHLINGTKILTADSQSTGSFTPFTLWQSQLVFGTGNSISLFNLNGTYQSSWSYNFSSVVSLIGFIQHDYAGRRYFNDYNTNPSNKGVYIYNQNSTFYTVLNRACVWTCAIKITKRNITLVSLQSPTSSLYYYNF